MVKIFVDCVGCGAEFNILEAKWCEHEGGQTKVCPRCGVCACDKKGDFAVVNLVPPIKDISALYVPRSYVVK